MADAKLLKDLQIKTNIVKRLVKEHECYIKEAESETARINKMKEDPAHDEYKLKKMNEVSQETRRMIPVVAQQAHKAAKELKAFLEANQEQLNDVEQAAQATTIVETANSIPLFY